MCKTVLTDLLENVQKPGRYVGGEWNAVKKDPATVDLKIALAFPDLYEVGMSYLGQKILYHLLNSHPKYLAERVFAPWPDFEAELRRKNYPLFSLENKIPLTNFDVLGFSLLYELNFSNILTILSLGKIPFLAADRDLSYPLVIGGGPAAFNPEPVAPLFDLFLIGDGEQAFLEIAAALQEFKSQDVPKERRLKDLSEVKGVYVPSLTTGSVQKRVLFPFEDVPFPEDILVPNIQIIFDRVSMEVARGSPQNCRFCQARQLYFPVRSKSPQAVKQTILRSVANTGYEDVSLSALSVGDYPCLPEVILDLMQHLDSRKVALSLSSLRPKALTKEIAENIIRVRKTGFTLVPEAGTDRLRRVINKHLSDEDIWEAVENAFSHGWRKIKLYFMLGLPTEKPEDIQGIVSLVEEIIRIGYRILKKSPQINLSVASFIPKPHTPFQWVAMTAEDELDAKHRYLKSRLRKYRFVHFKEHGLKNSVLEAVFSRGDRRLTPVLITAWQAGARFDSWKDSFDFSLWENAFQKNRLDYRQYLAAIDRKSVLPWDFISTGLKKSHLLSELDLALAEKCSPPCAPEMCKDCQGCDFGYRSEDISDRDQEKLEGVWHQIGQPTETIHRYRLTYAKTGDARYTSHIELSLILQRGIRRAGISTEFSQGYHPKMLLSFIPALALGMEGKEELMEFKSRFDFEPDEFLSALNEKLPPGVKALKFMKVDKAAGSLNEQLECLVYSLSFSDTAFQKTLTGNYPEGTDGRLAALRFAEDRIINSDLGTGDSSKYMIWIDQASHKIYFSIFLNRGKPPRIQELVKSLFEIDHPAFHLVREKIVFKGQDSA